MIHFRTVSLPKLFPPVGKSEDSLMISSSKLAIADGAGGTGIYCGEWAEKLVESLPTKPITTFQEFSQFLQPISEEFSKKVDQLVSSDEFKESKFWDEGSASTLVACWIVEKEIKWIAYGDSQVMYLDQNGMLHSFPNQKSSELTGGTHLLNCNQLPETQHLHIGTINLKDCNRILLASDAVSKMILEQNEGGTDINKHLIKLYNRANKENDFLKYVKSKGIEPDDYSLIISKQR